MVKKIKNLHKSCKVDYISGLIVGTVKLSGAMQISSSRIRMQRSLIQYIGRFNRSPLMFPGKSYVEQALRRSDAFQHREIA